jgi:hypothetical protein
MKRSLKAALGIVLIALAVPAAALATRHDGREGRHHHHQFQTGLTGVTGATGPAATVGFFDQTTGTLTLALPNQGSVTGTVGDGTQIVCLGSWQHFAFQGRHGRRFTTLIRDHFHHGDWGQTGASGPTGPSGDTGSQGSDQGQGNDQGEGGTQGGDQGHHHHNHDNGGGQRPQQCDSSLLVHGASVLRASLEITPQGVEFGVIVLLPAVQ